jgi:hypothetical protein
MISGENRGTNDAKMMQNFRTKIRAFFVPGNKGAV